MTMEPNISPLPFLLYRYYAYYINFNPLLPEWPLQASCHPKQMFSEDINITLQLN